MNILFYLVPKSDVVFLYDDYTVEQAMNVMEKYRFTAVPVLNRQGKYVGSLREGDILWGLKSRPSGFGAAVQLQVKQLRRQQDNQPVNINCRMEQLLQTAVNQNYVPVIDDAGIFIGIVTRKSIMTYFTEKTGSSQAKSAEKTNK